MSKPADGQSRPLLNPPAGADPARHLWSLWRQGQRPDLRDFLSDAGQLTPAQVAAVLLIDQRERWHDGHRIPAETYLELYPGLHGDMEFVVEIVYGEFLLREELGESPKPDDYFRRFPQYAGPLRVQIDLHDAIQVNQNPGPVSRVPQNGAELTEPETGVGPSREAETVWPVLPGYEILGELGRGGMGIVYRARQVELNRQVALKMIRAGQDAGPDQMARFKVEAEAVARLQHPHIVQIYEIGKQVRRSGGRVAECPFMALEFVEGGSLAQHLAGRPQPPRQSAQLVETVARAMHFAHQRGILHRDLKPSNILLSQVQSPRSKVQGQPEELWTLDFGLWTPKIADFGLAKVLEEGHLGQTETGSVLGTPSYMAPEQAGGQSREIGVPTDVYALGAILYEMLTGRPPFRAATSWQTIQQVVSSDPVSPRSLAVVPRDLEIICLKCLAKDPARRYASAQALVDDLQRFLTGQPIQARTTSTWERLVKWVKRRPSLAALAAVSGLAVVTVFVVVLLFNFSLQRQRDATDFKRREAVANLRKAREAVDRLLARVSEVQLLDVPKLQPLRQQLLQDALQFYQDFSLQVGDDPDIRYEIGRAYRRLGVLYDMLGQKEKAEGSFRDAIALLDRLAAEFPTPAYRQELATAQQSLGYFLASSPRDQLAATSAESEALSRQAIDLYEKLIAAEPDEVSHRAGLANTLNNLGLLFNKLGRPGDQQPFAQALEVLSELVRRNPAVLPDYADKLAIIRSNLATLKDPAEAEKLYRQNIDFLEPLIARYPSNSSYQSKLAVTYGNLGDLLAKAGRTSEGKQALRRNLSLRQQLAEEAPDYPHCHTALAEALRTLADVFVSEKNHAEARPLMEQAVNHRRTAIRMTPGDSAASQDLFADGARLAEILIQLGDHAEAAKTAEEAVKVVPAAGQEQAAPPRSWSAAFPWQKTTASSPSQSAMKAPRPTPPRRFNFSAQPSTRATTT